VARANRRARSSTWTGVRAGFSLDSILARSGASAK
jgi:hypothetical protein